MVDSYAAETVPKLLLFFFRKCKSKLNGGVSLSEKNDLMEPERFSNDTTHAAQVRPHWKHTH